MKKLLIALVFLSLAVATPTFTGCSSLGGGAHKVEAAILPSVNVAMEQWKTHVLAGKSTQAQLDAVKVAYNSYYSAAVTAKAAEIAWINSKSTEDQTKFTSAVADSSTKGAAVIALITTYMTVK